MSFKYTLNGNDIVVEPADAALYEADAPGVRDEVQAAAQRRADATGKPVEVFLMHQWGLELGDVVHTALPTKLS